MKVHGQNVAYDDIVGVQRALDWHIETGKPFWYNWVSARAVVHEQVADRTVAGASLAATIAMRLMRRAARDGRIQKAGGGLMDRSYEMTQPTTTPAEIEALCKRLERGVPFKPTTIDATAPNATGFAEPDLQATVALLLEAAAKLREMAGALERCAECDPEGAMYARAALGGSHG